LPQSGFRLRTHSHVDVRTSAHKGSLHLTGVPMRVRINGLQSSPRKGTGHSRTCACFDEVRSRASFRRFERTQMSMINEMPPIAPQAHFISDPDLGLISHTRLVTTSKAKMNTVARGGATFGLVTGPDYKPEATLQADRESVTPVATRARTGCPQIPSTAQRVGEAWPPPTDCVRWPVGGAGWCR
jgi:hypothetical protein